MKINKILVFLRVLIGTLFLVSGIEKLTQPYENFLYIIQSYQFLNNSLLEKMAALSFPWVELILGVFLFLGLWTKLSIIGLWLFTSSFIIVVGQAIIRQLPIDQCGCFGDLVHIPLHMTFVIDLTVWIILAILFKFISATRILSLDNYFLKKEES